MCVILVINSAYYVAGIDICIMHKPSVYSKVVAEPLGGQRDFKYTTDFIVII